MHTFYLPAADWGTEAALPLAEAKHAAQVLRLHEGETVRLLDGQGREGLFRLATVGKKNVGVQLLQETVHPQPAARAIIALAFSKAVRRGFFLEKAVELGAHEIWLWQGDHSQGRLPHDAAENCQGQMIAGIKQCGNPWMPQVRALTKGITEVIEQAASADHRLLPWEQQHDVPMLTPAMAGQAGLTVYVIGPEGGFSERELGLLRGAEFLPVSLGQRILRCETAATLCLGLHWWASQQPKA
jgi:16S rRNA (uracil1498-N3)-methyltransferase